VHPMSRWFCSESKSFDWKTSWLSW
jgi:hypothetical protein